MKKIIKILLKSIISIVAELSESEMGCLFVDQKLAFFKFLYQLIDHLFCRFQPLIFFLFLFLFVFSLTFFSYLLTNTI
ncbi:hypothetical protein M0811_08691 [Anaeramoeba ignava]|uniref:Uncharacterized protein n=1 Tax=Anaeramoeba ignava TaxID=1746090 RepID=A0A9Q0RCC0_ANAIG|nr:hypothetical protein M0811_08691 [Anaeramoeba ignava]